LLGLRGERGEFMDLLIGQIIIRGHDGGFDASYRPLSREKSAASIYRIPQETEGWEMKEFGLGYCQAIRRSPP
jgi:hypothetical protein